ncbi:MAG TPA: HTTM domain-containing protein [Acidimicrobiales bacterium]|nr:HTTM domain-containing protein [Acidimicrobiales bacterium]
MRLPAAWERFWFSPEPTSTLAVLRIVYGLLLLAWTTTLSLDAATFFSRSGILPERPPVPWTWTVLDLAPSDTALAILLALLVWAAICLVVGFHTRLAAVVAFVAVVSLHRRNPFVFQAGDNLLRSFAFYFMFAPAGAALSVDRWRQARARFWEFPRRAVWALRLVQVQLSILYLFSVWSKLGGRTWHEGTATSWAMRVDELVRLRLPPSITESLLVSNVVTYGTLAVELALAVLIWNRRARPWVLAAGVGLHLSIEVTMRVGFFSLVVLLYYVAFIPPELMTDRLLGLRARLRRSRLLPLRLLGSAGPEAIVQPQLPWPDPLPEPAPATTAPSRDGSRSADATHASKAHGTRKVQRRAWNSVPR